MNCYAAKDSSFGDKNDKGYQGEISLSSVSHTQQNRLHTKTSKTQHNKITHLQQHSKTDKQNQIKNTQNKKQKLHVPQIQTEN